MKSARESGLVACEACGSLSVLEAHNLFAVSRCSLCQSVLHSRKPMSVQRSWAWLIAGVIAYFPANFYPIMHTSVFGVSEPNTILSGILVLVELKSYPVALVVFVASIVVPLLKFFALSWLLISIQRGSRDRKLDRARLFRVTEFIGRWSMIDVFVVAILAALVQIGSFAQIDPGIGVMAFGATVIFTMLSALSLDPRLIWD